MGYACDPRTVDEEFLLSKKEYEYITGRSQGKHNILAYHIRQSFKPGEITPEKAMKLGDELARRFTKGKHAYIVAVHTDCKHIHCAIVFNSTTLDCKGKFNNFLGSSFAIRRLSDLICAEHGLSIIENPKPSKGENYADWLGDKQPSWKEKLRRKIDEVLPSCATFDDFLVAMREAGYTVNDKRKHLSFVAPGQAKPTRLDTLKGKYTEAAIRELLAGARIISSGGMGGRTTFDSGGAIVGSSKTRVSLLIDIQEKIRMGKGEGYEHWCRIFNIRQSAKTLVFLKENGIDSYDDLVERTSVAKNEFSAKTTKIKNAEKRMAEISELQKHIGTYSKTRDIYARYKASGWNADFYEEHRAEITLHRAAKKYFENLGLRKLPSMQALKQEYAELAAERKKLYVGYRAEKENMQALLVARGNAERMLGITSESQRLDVSHGQTWGGSQRDRLL